MREPLIVLPAMMCDGDLFRHQLGALSRKGAVMVAPVSGGERFEEIAEGLRAALPERFALWGVSLGGLVAMELLRIVPERVTRVCLMGCSPLAETPADAAAREPLIISARMGKLEEAMAGTLALRHLAPGPDRMRVMAEVMEMAGRQGGDVFARQSRALQKRRDQQGTLRRSKVQALIATGAEDPLCTVARAEFLAALMPNATLQVIQGAGHLPPLEAPKSTLKAVSDWMDTPLGSG